MAERDHALGHEGIGHRDVQTIGEFAQLLRGLRAHHAVAGQDHRIGGLADERCRGLDEPDELYAHAGQLSRLLMARCRNSAATAS